MQRCWKTAMLGFLILGISNVALAGEKDLPRRTIVKTPGALERVLAAVEKQAAAKRMNAGKSIRNSTLLLQVAISNRMIVSGRAEVLYPRAIVASIVRAVDRSMQRKEIAKTLVSAMKSDGFASLDAKFDP